jgi:hypothetical protein
MVQFQTIKFRSFIPLFPLFLDTTVGPLLGAWNMWNSSTFNSPPYASHIEFELWKNKKSSSFSVLIRYNGVDQVIMDVCKVPPLISSPELQSLICGFTHHHHQVIPSCGSTLCPVEGWLASIAKNTPRSMEEWQAACKPQQSMTAAHDALLQLLMAREVS